MENETVTVESSVSCARLEIALEKGSQNRSRDLNRAELQQAISRQNRKKVLSSASQRDSFQCIAKRFMGRGSKGFRSMYLKFEECIAQEQ
jgi:hypothetical protein